MKEKKTYKREFEPMEKRKEMKANKMKHEKDSIKESKSSSTQLPHDRALMVEHWCASDYMERPITTSTAAAIIPFGITVLLMPPRAIW